jgi:hypothetical protein
MALESAERRHLLEQARMPPPPPSLEFDPRFVRTCTFATLHTPGYGTRVTLFNGVRVGQEFATPFTVTMSAFDRQGTYLGESKPFLHLEPGGAAKIDVDDILGTMATGNGEMLRDVLGILHLTPDDAVGKRSIEVTPQEIMAHMLATDDFVEFYSYRGDVVTGVAYQTGPMNDARLFSTRTTTIQAPKVIVSDRVDTIFLLMNTSTSLEYNNVVTLRFRIMAPDGETVAASEISVPPFTFRLLSTRDVLTEAGALDRLRELGGCGTLFGLAANGTVVPLTMTRNDETGAIAVDHTLPPTYYISAWGGDLRKRGNARLEQELFADARYAAVP